MATHVRSCLLGLCSSQTTIINRNSSQKSKSTSNFQEMFYKLDNHHENLPMSTRLKHPENLSGDVNNSEQADVPVFTNASVKSKLPHPKPFLRALSFESHDATINNFKLVKHCHDKDLKLAYQSKTNLEPVQNRKSEMLDSPLKALHCDSGIICSDEDLRLILSSKISNCLNRASIKRKKMKSSRSLSLDSTFFKLRIKTLKTDSSNWLSKLLSRDDKTSNCDIDSEHSLETSSISNISLLTTASNISSIDVCHFSTEDIQSNSDTEENLKTIPLKYTLDLSDLSSGDNLDDDTSILLSKCNHPTSIGSQHSSNQSKTASRVLWTNESEVDVDILGHAIEYYLTSSLKSSIHDDNNHCKEHRNSDTLAPVISTLKDLFVK